MQRMVSVFFIQRVVCIVTIRDNLKDNLPATTVSLKS